MTRFIFLLYGVISYAIFLASFLYAIGFVDNVVVSKTIDGEPEMSLLNALLINMGVLTIFALQHSIMARKSFKKWWTRIIPEPIERSTYVLFSSVCLIAIIYFWQPIGGTIWRIESEGLKTTMLVISLTGFFIVFISTFIINHFDLFGLRQVWFYFKGKPIPPLVFKVSVLYKYVRHPLYLGFVIAFWFTPVMTIAHFVFAVLTTGYILVGIYLEEKDLVKEFGETYRSYRKKVPKLVPFTKRVK